MTTMEADERRPIPTWRIAMWGLVAALLLAPAVAMRLTADVAWTASDFAVAALLLGGAALLIEAAVRTLRSTRQRTAAVAAIVAALALIWLQGAVGLV